MNAASISPHTEGCFPGRWIASPSFSKGSSEIAPVWSMDNAIYHVSIHLADSVPALERAAWLELRLQYAEKAKSGRRSLTDEEVEVLKSVYNERIEKYLTAGYGECILRQSPVADTVVETLEHDHGSRYALHCWTVMPNHVHVIVQFASGADVKSVIEQWKRVSGHRINRTCGRNGPVWTDGFYSRIIRDHDEYLRQVSYVMANPDVAHLLDGFRQKRYVS